MSAAFEEGDRTAAPRGGPQWLVEVLRNVHEQSKDPTSRYVQLATAALDGGVSCRTCVYRGFWEPEANGPALKLCTDSRSTKIDEIRENPRAEICWYFRETQEQFRVRGRLQLVGQGDADPVLASVREGLWGRMSDAAKAVFRLAAVPGKAVARNLEGNPGGGGAEPPAPSASDGGGQAPPDTFCLLLLWPSAVDHLILKGPAHQRFMHKLDDAGPEARRWMTASVNP